MIKVRVMTKVELINKIRNNRSFDLRDSEFYEPWDTSDETIKNMADDFYYLLKDVLNYLAGKEEPKFKVGDRISFKHCKENRLKIIKVGDKGYYCEDGTFLHFDNQYLWELVEEQEPRYPSFEESQGECHPFQDIALNG